MVWTPGQGAPPLLTGQLEHLGVSLQLLEKLLPDLITWIQRTAFCQKKGIHSKIADNKC